MLRLALIVFTLLTRFAAACDVPVFRYALERWAGDPFQLVVFHAGKLEPSLDAQLAALESDPDLESKKVTPNWQIVRVDTSKAVPKLWSTLGATVQKTAVNTTTPVAALCTPEWRVGDEPLWSGELTNAVLAELSQSAKRSEVSRHLLAGTAVVWLLLESGDKAKNEALATLLSTESERLRNTIPEPHGVKYDGVNVLSPLPIAISFATVRVAAADAAEAMLIRQLTNGEPITEPCLYPIFGRGRVLGQFHASKVDKGLLEETAAFLCGACSCQVKAQNPGFDLLLHANWNSIFGEEAVPPPEAKDQPASKPEYLPLPKRKTPKA